MKTIFMFASHSHLEHDTNDGSENVPVRHDSSQQNMDAAETDDVSDKNIFKKLNE